MKSFDIPEFYRSPIISKVKTLRKFNDPRKKDFTPTILDFGNIEFHIARHFGFCYGVENAIEISYRAIQEHPDKRIFLLSQMIHNPEVNKDLQSNGVQFIQETDGTQLIPWEDINQEDVVIIPAFGTTIEIKNKLDEIGVDVAAYNTTCPFVEKVWNRSEKLGNENHTIIIHGKYNHEETRATFSHSKENAPSLIVKDMKETKFLGDYILGKISTEDFLSFFKNKMSDNFNPEIHLNKIGVVNQTTMLATETQEIADYLKNIMLTLHGNEKVKEHIADTRDTLCYATNDNQSSTIGLLESNVDFAIVVGGYNSSNTTHLVELLEQKFKTFFISGPNSLIDAGKISHFDIRQKQVVDSMINLSQHNEKLKIAITSGASCPDAIVDQVIQKILSYSNAEKSIEEVINTLQ